MVTQTNSASRTPGRNTDLFTPPNGGNGNGSYDASDIVTLEGLEAVRKRPGMYIGGTGGDGLMHLVWELIDNGVDEAGAGYANRIDVTLHADGSVEVGDNGRGIPIDPHPTKKVSALEVVLTELHSGGKFGGGVYGASGGLHGVGASVVNALSSRLRAEVDRDGATWQLWFVKQKAGQFDGDRFAKGHKLRKVRTTRKTGTRIRFWPDLDMFDPDAAVEFESIRQRAQQACFLMPGLRIRLEDKRRGSDNQPVDLISHGGLADLVGHLSDSETVTEVISIPGEGEFDEKVPVDGAMTVVTRQCQVDIAMRWVKSYDAKVVTFVNTIPTPNGGTHLAGFERALTRAVNDSLVADSKKLARLAKQGNDRAQREDVQEGLLAAVKVTLPEPQFRGQTKQELGTPSVQSIVYNVLKDGLESWFQTGPKSHVTALQSKIVDAVVNRVSARQTLENKRRAASLGSTGMPDKLGRLPGARRGVRADPGRGRLGRRPGQGGAQRREHGHPAPARQGGERRQVIGQTGAGQRRGPGPVHRHGGRLRRRLRHGQSPVRAHRHPVRCRRGRQPYPLPAAHPHPPLHASDAGSGSGIRRPAPAVHRQGGRPDPPGVVRRPSETRSSPS